MPNKTMLKKHSPINMLFSSLINLPTPTIISFSWNFGSLLGSVLIMQIISGLILSFFLDPHSTMAFQSIFMTTRNIQTLWMIQWIHMNGATLFFIMIYLHTTRNLYFSLYKNKKTFLTGITILLMLMATAFLGYVLPWGQMSFWGASVITNLLSAIPFIGPDLTIWLWGGFSIDNPTLKRFFSLHFLLPFIIAAMSMIHLITLHESKSQTPLNLKNSYEMTSFHPSFTMKDMMGLLVTLSLLMMIILQNPLLFNDPENFNPSNPLITPIHIQPEWYFLFAYAILRSIPNKLTGVLALLASILILIMPTMKKINQIMKFNPTKKIMFTLFLSSFILLTWIGANPVESPFITIGQTLSIMYFLTFLMFTSSSQLIMS